MKSANQGFSRLGTTIFEVMSRLAEKHGAVNLGQGFPDEGFPRDVLEKAADATLNGSNQYPSMMGLPALRQAVARHDKRFYGMELDWQKNILVTQGACEALAVSLLGLLEAGDEVVVIQPLYDSYVPVIRRADATPRFVTLQPPNWEVKREQLEQAFSGKTKAVILNNPQNPCAKVWTRQELGFVAELAKKYDAYVICDEVYEHIVFDRKLHTAFATLPGMADRTIKIGSAGKTFSLTGWRIGYISAPANVLAPIAKAHQFMTYTSAPNLQAAVAYGLDKDDTYYQGLTAFMAKQRDLLSSGLKDVGFTVLPCQGTYFLTVDIRSVGFFGTDDEFCEKLVKDVGVAAIPVSAFYEVDAPKHLARFCFCKKDSTLDAALTRLRKHYS